MGFKQGTATGKIRSFFYTFCVWKFSVLWAYAFKICESPEMTIDHTTVFFQKSRWKYRKTYNSRSNSWNWALNFFPERKGKKKYANFEFFGFYPFYNIVCLFILRVNFQTPYQHIWNQFKILRFFIPNIDFGLRLHLHSRWIVHSPPWASIIQISKRISVVILNIMFP